MSAPDLAAQRAVLDRVGSLEREQAVLYARQARARAEMVRLWGADQGVLVELAGTARVGQAKAGGQLGRAERLVEHFAVALGLLELGVMRVGTVEIVLSLTKNCRTEVMELLDARLSEQLCELDAVDVRRLVAATVPEIEAELDPAAQQERHEQARANRGVWAFGVQDGMARIGAELDQISARRWSLDFEELVRAQKVLDDRDGIRRSQAQRRADVFAQLPSRVLALADAAVKDTLAELLAQAKAQLGAT
ncbi:MAG: 13E12 repeat family protein, partial [Actinomycetota bacterium]|nr:13E12 repeat family protein [Actinomycetota bacterium]